MKTLLTDAARISGASAGEGMPPADGPDPTRTRLEALMQAANAQHDRNTALSQCAGEVRR